MQLGRYQLVREIARSNDIVYEARDPQMNRRVAVKELLFADGLTGAARRDRIERFRREAKAAGNLNHPNIVTIHEFGEDRGRYFIAMEFLEGGTLRQRMSSGGPLPVSEAVRIASALCDALEYAHARGIVHRDIKPDNVHLLPNGQVKLTDFGIARILAEEQLTVAGQVFGTPSYMAPEQIRGGQIGPHTDVFALGVLLYEMIAGRKPFPGDSVVTITYKIMSEPTPPLPGGTPALEAAILRATAKEPTARFAHAGQLRDALRVQPTQMPYAAPSAHAPYPPGLGGNGAGRTMAYGAATQLGVAPGLANPAPTYQAPAPQIPQNLAGGQQGISQKWIFPICIGALLMLVAIIILFGDRIFYASNNQPKSNNLDEELRKSAEIYRQKQLKNPFDGSKDIGITDIPSQYPTSSPVNPNDGLPKSTNILPNSPISKSSEVVRKMMQAEEKISDARNSTIDALREQYIREACVKLREIMEIGVGTPEYEKAQKNINEIGCARQ